MRRVTVDAFLVWILEQPDSKQWHRSNACACPLHDFIESETGESLSINSPELSEHWGERETQSWPTPWWMTWMMRAVDHCGDDKIKADELLAIALLMIRTNFHAYSIPLSAAEFAKAA